jgi:uncharacterized protein
MSDKSQIKNLDDVLQLPTFPSDLRAKIEKIRHLFKDKRILIAYSGGIDSTLVCYFAKYFGQEVLAITIRSAFTPSIELDNARIFSQQLGIPWRILDVDALNVPQIRHNHQDRCYYCKQGILSRLTEIGIEQDFEIVAEGTNFSDLSMVRAGIKALRESTVRSPLLEAEFTKADIIQMTEWAGLPTQDVPSQACLASRIPFGVTLTHERLRMIDRAETFIRQQSGRFADPLRVRLHVLEQPDSSKPGKYLARIETTAEMGKIIWSDPLRTNIEQYLIGLGFTFVVIDLGGFRSGSMHQLL